jgi:4-diphosphocytidyl-2-C-methyl-D-erythritol kinase
MTRTYYAPAKINLWLRVFAPDASGYHPLDTLFCAIDLQDELQVGPGVGIDLDVTGADTGPVEDNLAYRAAQDYFFALGHPPGVSMHLKKKIPVGAGLGGGSSDAAAVLRALQDQFDDALPQSELMDLAARLGSDVPFFLCGSSWARASGRGEVLQPLRRLPSRPVLVVVPDFPIATKDAYRWLDERGELTQPRGQIALSRSWQDVENTAVNTFESVLFERFPALAELRDGLDACGATIAMVSGSGSALFGVFVADDAAREAQQGLAQHPGITTHLARTLE